MTDEHTEFADEIPDVDVEEHDDEILASQEQLGKALDRA